MRFLRISAIELLVILCVIGILASLLLPAVGSKKPLTEEDLNFDDWRSGAEAMQTPAESIRVRDVDLAGKWSDRLGWLMFDIEPLAEGRYSVSFLSRARCGLSGSVQLKRFGVYDEGALVLDRPVRELRGTTYTKLYSVRADGAIYLLPASRANQLDEKGAIPHWGVLARVAPR